MSYVSAEAINSSTIVDDQKNHASYVHKSLDYVSDYELESACKDAPCVAPSMVDWKIFAVLVVRVYHVVLTPSFKLLSFFYIYYDKDR